MSAWIKTIIYANALPFAVLLIFLFFLSFNSVFDRRQTKLFFFASLINIIVLVAISLDSIVSASTVPGLYLVRRFTSFCNFAFSPIIPMLLYQISKDHSSRRAFFVPAAVNMVVCTLSIFTGIVFYISPDNQYGRGPLFLLPFSISVFYMLLLILQATHRHKKIKQIERRYLLGTILLLILGMALEIGLGFRFLTWDFTAAALVLYYLLLNIQSAMLDSLTSAYNRRMYDRHLSLIDGRAKCEIALLDINQFKIINDLQGHEAGDRCLISLTEILSYNFSSFANIFRIGGDEFVVITKKPNTRVFTDAMEKALQEATAKGIPFAYGHLTYDPAQPIQQALAEVDRLMYLNKKQQGARP